MKKSTLVFVCAVFCGALLINIIGHLQIRDARSSIQVTYKPPRALLPPDIIQMLAGEFKGLWANYMILEVGSFIGSEQARSEEDYRNIYRGLKQALILDPYFQQTYMLVQGILPWQAAMPIKANELLDMPRRHRSWDWRPGHYMGFNYYYFLNDYAKASEVLLETAKVKGAPVLLAVLGARFAQRAERTQAAIDLLEQMLQDEEIVGSYRMELHERMDALKATQIIEQALVRYRDMTGSHPNRLEDLVAYGLLNALPNNPYGVNYHYESETGRVSFDDVEKRTRRRTRTSR